MLSLHPFSGIASAQTGTLAPVGYQTILDDNGNPISGGCVWTYTAGTTTAAATYTTAALNVANTNPIQADSAGRFVAFLSPGAAYKFLYEGTGCVVSPPTHGTTIKTVDNISAVPSSAATVDITALAGEAISAGQCAYVSDGSGSKTQGSWYKCDAAQAYSSVQPIVGVAVSAIANGATGTVRIAGSVTGLSVSTGSTYYAGSAGALTSTAPVQARKLGVADSSTSLIVTANPGVSVSAWVDDFRLTLTSGTPVTTSDVTGASATTIYCSPLTGNRIDLPDSAGNPVRLTSAEFSIAVPATTATMYDIFAYNNAGVATLELLAWTNDTTRATAIIRTAAGRYYKTGDLTRMYVGSFRTTGTSGQTEDSAAKRFLWNYYNRKPRQMLVRDSTASWTYTTATWRQVRATAANELQWVTGVAEDSVAINASAVMVNASNYVIGTGIGLDSTSTPTSAQVGGVINGAGGFNGSPSASAIMIPAVGYHFAAWLEISSATGTTTWNGTATAGFGAAYAGAEPGISGVIWA